METYIDVPQSEAENPDGTLKPGYQRWAYSWKLVVPETPEDIEAHDKLPKAIKDLKALIVIENPDTTKWKIEEIVAHLKEIERIIQVR